MAWQRRKQKIGIQMLPNISEVKAEVNRIDHEKNFSWKTIQKYGGETIQKYGGETIFRPSFEKSKWIKLGSNLQIMYLFLSYSTLTAIKIYGIELLKTCFYLI